MCPERPTSDSLDVEVPKDESDESILVAVPARDDKKIEVYHFPSEKLLYMVPRVQPTDTGEHIIITASALHSAPDCLPPFRS